MDSKSLAWQFVVSGLLEVKDADARLLDDLTSLDPNFQQRALNSTKERLALKLLKTSTGMDRDQEPPVHPDSEEIPLDMSAEDVLCQNLQKHGVGSNFLSDGLRRYFLSKENITSKSDVNELKTEILKIHTTLRKSIRLPSEETQPDANTEPRNVKKHRIDNRDVNPQSGGQISPSQAPGAISEGSIQDGNACPEKEKQNMDKLSTTRSPDVKESIPACHTNADLSIKLYSSTLLHLQETGLVNLSVVGAEGNSTRELPQNSTCNLPCGSSILSIPACHTNTDLSSKKSSSTLPHLHETGVVNASVVGAEDNSTRELPQNSTCNLPCGSSFISIPACHTNTDPPSKKSSSTLPHLHKTGVVNASAVGAEGNSTKELPQNSTCNLPCGSSIINAANSQLLRQISATKIVDKSNSSLQRDSSKLESPSGISNKSHGGPIVPNYDESLYRRRKSTTGSQDENFRNHKTSAFLEVSIEDDCTYDIPAKLLLISDKTSTYLSRLQAHVGGDWASKGFCVECLDDGASLTCKSCCFAFHENCLDPLARPENPGHFYCPFCSYKKAAKKLQMAMKDAKQSWKAFRTFIRTEVPEGHQKGPSSPLVIQEPNLETADGNVNSETIVATDKHHICKGDKIIGGENEQTMQIDSQVGDKRKYPVRECMSDPIMTSNHHMTTRASSNNQKGYPYPVKHYSNPTLRRNQRFWGAEEVQALKEIMQEYVEKNVKKIPWSNILEHHRSSFHATRIPGDLKIKWWNMNRVTNNRINDNPVEPDDSIEPDEAK